MRTSLALFVFMLASPAPTFGQSALPDLQAQAETALVAGRPAETAQIAAKMRAIEPDSFVAHYLTALALADLGDIDAAADAAVLAYRSAPDEAARFDAARLVATTRFRMGAYTRAAFWLRRAANHTTDAADLDALREAYAAATAANPLSFRIAASVAPTDNINDGSEDGELRLEGIDLTLILPEDRRALSGVAYSASAEVRYRLSDSARQTTALSGYLSGQAYTLSRDAKDLLASSPNPDVRAVKSSDFATAVAAIGLERQQNNLSPLGPVTFGLTFGRYWEGGEHLLDFRDLSLSQIIPIGQYNTLTIAAFQQTQDTVSAALVDSTTTDLTVSLDHFLANDDLLQFSLTGRHKDAGFENTYDEVTFGIGYAVAEPFYGVQLSTALDLGYRTFDEFTTTLDGRHDRFVSATAAGTFQDVSYFGFSPQLSLTATRTQSTAEEITSSALELSLGVQSSF